MVGEWRRGHRNGGALRHLWSAADSMIHFVLIQAFIRGRDPAAAPSISTLLSDLGHPSINRAYRAGCNATKNPLLQCVYTVGAPSRDVLMPASIAGGDWARRLVSETVRVYGAKVPVTILGEYHQVSMSGVSDGGPGEAADLRHSLGTHYTPPALVDYLTCRALQFMLMERGLPADDLRILDPACGCGAFPAAAFRFLTGRSQALGVCDKLDMLLNGIRACDIDRAAATLALQSLLLTAWESCLEQRVDAGHADRIRSLVKCIRCTDFLRGRPAFMDACRPNVIIGGPPFVRIEQLHRTHAKQIPYYRDRFVTAQAGQFNLYMLFIERALKMLAPGGCLAMSVSGSFLRSKSGQTLRGLISDQCRVIEIVEFDDHGIYPDAGTSIVLLLAWKTDQRSCSRHVFVKGTGEYRAKLAALYRRVGRHDDVVARPFASCGLTADAWRFSAPTCHGLLRRMEAVGVPLAALTTTLSLGACTGADDVFMLRRLSDKTSRLVVARHRVSGAETVLGRAATRPFLRGRGIGAYETKPSRFLCVFPYDRAGAVLDEDVFARRFPLTYEYVASHRSELAKRDRQPGRPWYALRTVDVTRALAARKLIASTVGRPSRFAFDVDGVLCHNSVLTIGVNWKAIDPYFLLAVLNSRPMRLYVRCRMLPMGEGRCAYRLDAVRQLPIPVPAISHPDACAAVARYARMLTGKNVAPARRRLLQRTIDRLITKLYGVTGREAACVDEAHTIAG